MQYLIVKSKLQPSSLLPTPRSINTIAFHNNNDESAATKNRPDGTIKTAARQLALYKLKQLIMSLRNLDL